MLSKKEAKYKEIIPLAQLIWDLHIGKSELISFKIAVNEAAALHVLNNLRDYNKKGQLKKELSSLYLQKYAISQFCSLYSQVIMTVLNLQTHGITEEQIISLNTFLENNRHKYMKSNS